MHTRGRRFLRSATAALILGASGCGGSTPPPFEAVARTAAERGPGESSGRSTTEAACVERWEALAFRLHFPSGGWEVDREGRKSLTALVAGLTSRGAFRRIRVEGHSDPCFYDAWAGTPSQHRAEAVAFELVELGFPRDQIETVGYGNSQPLSGDCERTRGLNLDRRVEFALLVCD